MKNREYYERLISDSLDRVLSDSELAELEDAFKRDPSLVEFQQELIRQAELARSLPYLSPMAALKLRRQKAPANRLLPYFWNKRVSLPLPLAALLSLALVAFGVTGMFAGRAKLAAEPRYEAKAIRYVQIERLKPAHVVLIPGQEENSSSNGEEL